MVVWNLGLLAAALAVPLDGLNACCCCVRLCINTPVSLELAAPGAAGSGFEVTLVAATEQQFYGWTSAISTKRIIPCLDVTGGRVVKALTSPTWDAGDPVEIALVRCRQARFSPPPVTTMILS
jgi:hypothetical protein